MSKVRAVAAVTIALLAGCGTQAADTHEKSRPPQAKPQDAQRRFETMRADCMKQKGFKYIPNVPAPRQVSEADRKLASGDYAAIKEFRGKYGFGVFSGLVYRKDPAVGGIDTGGENPNNPIVMGLSQTQLKAYRAAEKVCYRQAAKAVLGKDVDSEAALFDQLNTMSARLGARELDGDPQLVDLAGKFGDCLKAKGYPVGSLKPTAIAHQGRTSFTAQLNAVAKGQGRGAPSDLPSGAEDVVVFPNLTPDEARPYLAREIKAALDDLECGREFYAVMQPKSSRIDERVIAEFGPALGLA